MPLRDPVGGPGCPDGGVDVQGRVCHLVTPWWPDLLTWVTCLGSLVFMESCFAFFVYYVNKHAAGKVPARKLCASVGQ